MATTECPHCNHVIVDVESTAFACGTCPECGGELGASATREAKLHPGATVVRPAAPMAAGKRGADVTRTERAELDALLGAVLGGCRLEAVLGRGAMGVVYQARQLSLDRAVAVKVIRRELCSDPGLLQRFQREARMIGQFSTQHVVQIHEVGQESGHHFLVMELVAGGNLLTRVTALPGGRLPPDDAIRLLIEAAEGLREAERLGIIHRDIKPENLLIDAGGGLKIADFGISRSLNADVLLTRTEMVIGTPLYMSPEQCRGEKVDARTDMYALGATFCHLLAGRPPLRENSVPELLRRKTTIESLSPRKLADDGTIPESLSRVIERMTALDRDDRYATFADLVLDLKRVERGEVIAPLLRRSARQARARRLAWSAVAVVLVAVLALGADWGWRAWRRTQTRLDGGSGAVTAEQIEAETARLRKELRERPELVTQEMATSARSLAARASDPEAARTLRELGDDAERLASFRASANQLGAPSFSPPFVEVEEHCTRLRETADAATRGLAGAELRAHVGGEVARRTASLLSQSQAELASAATSLEQRARAGSPSTDLLVTAQQDLEALRRGAERLAATFPDATAALAATLPPERLDKIERDLRQMELSVGTVSDDVGLARLAELEEQFRSSGPKNYDFVDAMKVRDRLASGSPVKAQFERFASELDRGSRALGRLDDLRTEKPVARTPFDELAAFAARCLVAVEPLEPDWYADFFRAELTRRLEGDVQPARTSFADLTRRTAAARAAVAGGGDPASLPALSALLEQVATAHRNLATLFPELEAEWERAFPAAELAAARKEVEETSARQAAGMESSRVLDELAQRLDAVHSSAEWRAAKSGFEKELGAAASGLAAAGAGSDAAQARVKELEQRARRWSDHASALQAALTLAAGATHDLAAAESALESLAADGLVDAGVADAQEGVSALRSGFAALFDELDDGAAATAFAEAGRRLAGDVAVRAYADACQKQLVALDDAVGRSMQAVPAGRVLLPGSSAPDDVGSFFLDRCEVSIGEFSAFLGRLKADRVAWEPLVAELPGLAGADRDAIDRRLLSMPGCYAGAARLNDRLPIEQVSYAQALLFARLRSKDLPTFPEWWLATKGSLLRRREHRRFPCSDGADTTLRQLSQPDALVWGRRTPMAVDDGGVSIGFVDGGFHHLAGNVEEWTRASGDAAGTRLEAKVVGGGYTDGAEQEEYLAGEKVRIADARGAPERRVGFRAVLRPRDFFATAGLAPTY